MVRWQGIKSQFHGIINSQTQELSQAEIVRVCRETEDSEVRDYYLREIVLLMGDIGITQQRLLNVLKFIEHLLIYGDRKFKEEFLHERSVLGIVDG